jgi:hypothetical protein
LLLIYSPPLTLIWKAKSLLMLAICKSTSKNGHTNKKETSDEFGIFTGADRAGVAQIGHSG